MDNNNLPHRFMPVAYTIQIQRCNKNGISTWTACVGRKQDIYNKTYLNIISRDLNVFHFQTNFRLISIHFKWSLLKRTVVSVLNKLAPLIPYCHGRWHENESLHYVAVKSSNFIHSLPLKEKKINIHNTVTSSSVYAYSYYQKR